MKKVILFILLVIAASGYAMSIRFKQSIGGNAPDDGSCARQTYDGGYIAVGTTSSFTNGQSDIYVVKTDSNGIVMWTRNFGSANIEVGKYVEQTKDSSLIIVGYTNNTNGNGYDVYLVLLDRYGNKIWEKTYGNTDWEFAYCVHQTSDGGFIIGGGTYRDTTGEDMYLVKTDANGAIKWTKTYGGRYDDEAKSVRQTIDGGYILAGYTKSLNDTVEGDAYVVKTNSIGDTLWTRSYGGLKEYLANDIIECKNGDFTFCGRTYSFSNKDANMYLARTDNNGTALWEQTNNLKDSIYDSLEGIIELQNGKLVSIGVTYSYGGGQDDGYLLITDAAGNYIDGPTYGSGKHDRCFSVEATRDKGFIICGYTDSTKIGFNATNLLLIKTDSTGRLPSMKYWFSTNDINNSLVSSISAYPNPFTAEAHIIINTTTEVHPSDLRLILTDITGRAYHPNYNIINSQSKSIELQLYKADLPEGIYIIHYFHKQQPLGVSKVIVE